MRLRQVLGPHGEASEGLPRPCLTAALGKQCIDMLPCFVQSVALVAVLDGVWPLLTPGTVSCASSSHGGHVCVHMRQCAFRLLPSNPLLSKILYLTLLRMLVVRHCQAKVARLLWRSAASRHALVAFG